MSSKSITRWVAVEADLIEVARMKVSPKHRPSLMACALVGEIMASSTKTTGEYCDLTYDQIAARSKGALNREQIKAALNVLTQAEVIATSKRSAPNRAPQRVFVPNERGGVSPTTSDETWGDSIPNVGGLSLERGGLSPTSHQGVCNTSSNTVRLAKDFARRDRDEIRKPPKTKWATSDAVADYQRLFGEVQRRRAGLGLVDNPDENELWLWCVGKRHGEPLNVANVKALFPKTPCEVCFDSGWFYPMDENGDPSPIKECQCQKKENQ